MPKADLDFVFEGANQALAEATQEHVVDAVGEFGTAIAESVDGDFELDTADTRRFMRNFQGRRVSGINHTTREQLRQTLNAGEKAGDGPAELEARVRRVYQHAREDRSAMIARTEIVRASQYGATAAGRQNGLVNKQWISSDDSRVRDDHSRHGLHGQIVPMDEDFVSPLSGAHGPYPGEMSTAASSIGCRCGVAPTSRKARVELAGSGGATAVLAAYDTMRAPIALDMALDLQEFFRAQEVRAIAAVRAARADLRELLAVEV